MSKMRTKTMLIYNVSSDQIVFDKIKVLTNELEKKKGLQGADPIGRRSCFLFLNNAEGIDTCAIHMRNVTFPICVLWLSKDWRVVDKGVARPSSTSLYAPKYPASHIIECHIDHFNSIDIGDILNPVY